MTKRTKHDGFRAPKRIPASDNVNSFWNYGMSERELRAFLNRNRP